MTLLIIFAVVFATIIFAIVLERLIRCPILVGFAFFAVFLIVAAIFDSVALVIVAIALGILAFIVAFLDCIFRRSRFFRNNRCLTCECDDNEEDDENSARSGRNRRRNNCNCNYNCNCGNNSNDTLTILNSNGRIVARINGNNVTCLDNSNDNGFGCNKTFSNSGVNLVSGNGNIALADGNILTTSNTSSNCGCSGRNNRYRR